MSFKKILKKFKRKKKFRGILIKLILNYIIKTLTKLYWIFLNFLQVFSQISYRPLPDSIFIIYILYIRLYTLSLVNAIKIIITLRMVLIMTYIDRVCIKYSCKAKDLRKWFLVKSTTIIQVLWIGRNFWNWWLL